MNNSTFGKTMENLRKRINVRFFNNAEDYKKYVGKPILTFNKSIYVGFSIPDLSKYFMYELHTNTLK